MARIGESLDGSLGEGRVRLKLDYDAGANAAYLRLSAEPVFDSEEVASDIVIDYDAKGRIVGLEVLDARAHLSPDLAKLPRSPRSRPS